MLCSTISKYSPATAQVSLTFKRLPLYTVVILSGALDSSALHLSYPTILPTSHITIILTSPLKTTVYFGSGASAVSYFSGLGRTPAPGASITDFLLDLVDDEMWPGGYADAHLTYLEKAAEAMSLRLLSQQENQQESRRKAGKLV